MTRRFSCVLGLALVVAACSSSSSNNPSSPDGGSPPPGDGGGGDALTDALAHADAPGDGGGDGGPTDPLDPSIKPPIDTNPGHYPSNVWVTDDMAKVRTNDPPGPLHWALPSAARNEFESFQVHVQATSAITGLTITVSDLKDARSGTTIPAAKSITVSRERYLTITPATLSDANGTSGNIPDPLVPASDVYFGETRNAFPVDVAQGSNASAWIDVYVPQGTPSGWYTGQVTVKTSTAMLATLPILLKLWQVDLPSTATLRSNFGMSWNGACVQFYGGYTGCGAAASGSDDAGVEYFHIMFGQFALDHRVSIGGVVYAGPNGTDWSHFDSLYGPLMDGTAKTRLPGAKLTAMNYTGGSSDTTALGNWATHFQAKGWMDRLDYYHCDEPASGNSCTFAQALAEENAVHMVSSTFPTLLTARIEDVTSNGLLDAVDIITPVVDQMQPHMDVSHRPLYDPFLMRSPQKRLFWYQSCDEHESCNQAGSPGPATATWPSYMADASSMRNRAFQWLAYVFKIQGELYYLSDLCFQQPCGPSGSQTTDPLQSIYAFSGNGDGTLFYAGKPSDIGGTHAIPLSSIRFELIREGMEDYELLHLLDAGGDGAFAMMQAMSFIRRADDFDSDPSHLMTAREALGDKLHQKSLGLTSDR